MTRTVPLVNDTASLFDEESNGGAAPAEPDRPCPPTDPKMQTDTDAGQDFLCAICDEAVRQETLSFFDNLAVPDLRKTMTCTSALESYISQIDDALDAERTAVKEECAKLNRFVGQLMSKLNSIQEPAATS